MWLIIHIEEFANNGINNKYITPLTLTSTTDKKYSFSHLVELDNH